MGSMGFPWRYWAGGEVPPGIADKRLESICPRAVWVGGWSVPSCGSRRPSSAERSWARIGTASLRSVAAGGDFPGPDESADLRRLAYDCGLLAGLRV